MLTAATNSTTSSDISNTKSTNSDRNAILTQHWLSSLCLYRTTLSARRCSTSMQRSVKISKGSFKIERSYWMMLNMNWSRRLLSYQTKRIWTVRWEMSRKTRWWKREGRRRLETLKAILISLPGSIFLILVTHRNSRAPNLFSSKMRLPYLKWP